MLNRDYKIAAQHLENAVEEDPNFTLALYRLVDNYLDLKKINKSMETIQKVMQQRQKLPERYQFWIKQDYFMSLNKWDESYENAKNWVELYPESINAHQRLPTIYSDLKYDLDAAISERKIILKLDPNSIQEFSQIGYLYEGKRDYAKALEYYKLYAERYPEKATSFTKIGDLYKRTGEFDQVKHYLKKALLLEPENISILLNLANLERNYGNIDGNLEKLNETLQSAKTAQDSSKVLLSLFNYYKICGQMNKAIDHHNLKIKEMAKYTSPLALLNQKLNFEVEFHLDAERDGEALKIVEEFENNEEFSSQMGDFAGFNRLYFYMLADDPKYADAMEEIIVRFEASLLNNKMLMIQNDVTIARAILHEYKNEFAQALSLYQEVLKFAHPGIKDDRVYRTYGNCYGKLKNFKKAEEYYLKALVILPYNPKYNYEIALLYQEMGKKKKALEHLKTALQVWENADADYIPAQKAREKLAEWKTPGFTK